jgi:hypothetical protein
MKKPAAAVADRWKSLWNADLLRFFHRLVYKRVLEAGILSRRRTMWGGWPVLLRRSARATLLESSECARRKAARDSSILSMRSIYPR